LILGARFDRGQASYSLIDVQSAFLNLVSAPIKISRVGASWATATNGPQKSHFMSTMMHRKDPESMKQEDQLQQAVVEYIFV